MDQPHHDGQPAQTAGNGTPAQRRKFLRHVGVAAATAAVVGITDVTGAKSACAAAKGSPGSKNGVIRGGANGWVPRPSRSRRYVKPPAQTWTVTLTSPVCSRLINAAARARRMAYGATAAALPPLMPAPRTSAQAPVSTSSSTRAANCGPGGSRRNYGAGRPDHTLCHRWNFYTSGSSEAGRPRRVQPRGREL